jgi:hypothetical protein
MATEKQRRANRSNARRSTGPRTQAGKNRSRFNALRHGLAAQSPVLPHENAAAFHEMRAALIEHYQPADIQELQLIDHIAHAQLRMERSRRFENGMFDVQLRHTKLENGKSPEPWAGDDTGIAACMCSPEFEKGYQVLFRYDSRAEAQYFKSVNALHRLREARLRQERAEAKMNLRTKVAGAAPAAEPQPLFALAQGVKQGAASTPQVADSTEETLKLASFGQTADVLPAASDASAEHAAATAQPIVPSLQTTSKETGTSQIRSALPESSDAEAASSNSLLSWSSRSALYRSLRTP